VLAKLVVPMIAPQATPFGVLARPVLSIGDCHLVAVLQPHAMDERLARL
jgi:hypothetical protein